MARLATKRERIACQLENVARMIRSYRSLGDRGSVRRMERVYRQLLSAA